MLFFFSAFLLVLFLILCILHESEEMLNRILQINYMWVDLRGFQWEALALPNIPAC